MPEIQVRSIAPIHLPALIAIDHRYITDRVWQMQLQTDINQVEMHLKEVRLPRSVQVDYPRDPLFLTDYWNTRPVILVAILSNTPVGYLAFADAPSSSSPSGPQTLVGTDMAVVRRFRRQGVAKALLLAGQEWAGEKGYRQVILEMQSKNYPAICLAQLFGYDFCGYNDRHFANRDIAVFFGKPLG